MNKKENRIDNNGFALLLTLVVVSVVLALGLSLLDVTLKQLTLSSTARDSEIAFHAADAALECAAYFANREQTNLLTGTLPTNNPPCFPGGAGASWVSNVTNNVSGNNNVDKFEYEKTWGGVNDEICSKFSIYLIDAQSSARTLLTNFFSAEGYTMKTNFDCPQGSVCQAIFASGYNRACTDIGVAIRTVERQIILLK